MVARFALPLLALLAACAADPEPDVAQAAASAGPFLTVLSDGTPCPKGAIVAGGKVEGQVSQEACIAPTSTGKWVPHGRQLTWRKDGTLTADEWLRMGTPHGTKRTLSDDGKWHAYCYLDGQQVHDGECTAAEWQPLA